MVKLETLYLNNKFFVQMKDFNIVPSGEWFNKIDLAILDRYLYLSARRKPVFLDIAPENAERKEVYRNIAAILSTYDYKLDGLYDSMFYDYDPIENYNRTEVQTHNEEVNTDDHVTKNDLGARNQTNRDKTTAFDSADYEKATDEGKISTDAALDTTTQMAYQDTSNGGYNLTVKGNIGTMSTQNMINQQREVLEFNFFNEILRIFYDTILMSDWETVFEETHILDLPTSSTLPEIDIIGGID